MTRDGRQNLAAIVAEEEHRRAAEEDVKEPHPSAYDVELARKRMRSRPRRISALLRAIRRSLWSH